MGNRQRTAFILVVAGIAIGVVFFLGRSDEPEYQGRNLSSWLTEFDNWDGEDTNAPVVRAVRAIGSNAVPVIVQMCLVSDSGMKQKLAVQFENHPQLFKYRFTTAAQRWARAECALRILGHDAADARSPFVAALTHESGVVRRRAVSSLGSLGPEAADCLPALIARKDDEAVRGNLMFALGSILRRPDLCVPVLIEGLSDTNVLVRQNAVHALGQFGPEASAAFPALTNALADKFTARRAEQTLRRIRTSKP